MSRSLPKKHNPHILADASPTCKSHLRCSPEARSRKWRMRASATLSPLFSPLDNCLTSIIANLNHLTLHSLDDDLLSRRRLGKTNLSVKPGQIGTSNATKPENLGLFEYAHLRAPLPKDLKGSEIFPSHNSAQHPETYFLMVSGLIRLCLSMTHQTSH